MAQHCMARKGSALWNCPQDYEALRDRDPDFYRGADSMEYGKQPDLPQKNVDKMVAELNDR